MRGSWREVLGSLLLVAGVLGYEFVGAAPCSDAVKSVAEKPGSTSVYSVFGDIYAAVARRAEPTVVIDFDDTLSQTGPRYVAAIQELNQHFELGLERHLVNLSSEQILYTNSFIGTVQNTLEAFGVDRSRLNEIFSRQGGEVAPAEAVFYKTFFDEQRVQKDFLFPGARFFFANLLLTMKNVEGKVVIASGRKDKYIETSKQSLVYSGIPLSLLEGEHIIWHFRPTGSDSIQSEVGLDFHNNKGELVLSLQEDSKREVVGVIDNEMRNIFQYLNRLPAHRIFYFDRVDATWSDPEFSILFSEFVKDLGSEKMGFTRFESWQVLPHEARWMRQESNANYVTDRELRRWGVPVSRLRHRAPASGWSR